MNTKQKRLALIGGGLAIAAAAVGLVMNAFQDNLVFFFSPSQVVAKEAPEGRASESADSSKKDLSKDSLMV